ncbi:hypothetical protein HDU76_002549 [Blyttiomyces sp. JEL0837]|nr:hypothetical protein HDU76_002549 [Blyttiomyces sp. JEL0837]
MFILKTIGSIVWGKADSSLFQLPAGQFYKVNPAGSKVSKTLVFKDATATVKRTNVPRNYQLLITRMFEEGEEEEDDLEDETEVMFLIDEVLRFRKFTSANGRVTFSWADPLDEKKTQSYEFVVDDSTNETSVDTFELVVYQSMFERRSGKDHTEASDEEMEAYLKFVKASANAAAKSSVSVAAVAAGTAGNTASRANAPKSVADTPVALTPAKGSAAVSAHHSPMSIQASTPNPVTPGAAPAAGPTTYLHNTPEGEPVVTVSAELYLYDSRMCQFNRIREKVSAVLLKTSPYHFFFTVSDSDGPCISQPLETSMNAQFNAESHSFVWLWREDDSDNCYPWSLKFFNAVEEESFKEAFGACMYETNVQERFDNVNELERDYLIRAYQEDVEMTDVEREDVAEEERQEEGEEDDEEEEEEEEEKADRVVPSAKGDKISQLSIGHKDRSFFVRGSSIGVLRHGDDNDLEYSTVINNVSTLGKESFTPRKVMLHEQDSAMLMMKPGDEHHVYRMDLNVGKVVEEWKVHDIMTVDDIIADSKKAPLTPIKTLVGINQNSIFRIDPRLSGTKLVDSESKTYTVKNRFSCATTTGKGELAVASAKGEIRLYNKLNIRAKTHLPGLGDPIIGVDTTENGKWIVATCANYLMLICTDAKDKNDKTFSGFTKSMGDAKPIPRRLQLRPEHVAFMGGNVSFTPARFNTGEDEEKSIVTSSGPYIITWNFKKVKQGKLFDYVIKQYQDNVVRDDFVFGQDKNIIVALPDDVQMVAKSKLQTPAKMMKSRSSIEELYNEGRIVNSDGFDMVKVFVDEKGQPLRFSIVRCGAREKSRDLVEKYGGLVVESYEKNIYMKLTTKELGHSSNDLYDVKYVADCVNEGKLLDKGPYWLQPNEAKTTRNPFTAKEDDLLLKMLKENPLSKLGGNQFYQDFAMKNPTHTWQAWRDRAVKHLIPKHQAALDRLKTEEEQKKEEERKKNAETELEAAPMPRLQQQEERSVPAANIPSHNGRALFRSPSGQGLPPGSSQSSPGGMKDGANPFFAPSAKRKRTASADNPGSFENGSRRAKLDTDTRDDSEGFDDAEMTNSSQNDVGLLSLLEKAAELNSQGKENSAKVADANTVQPVRDRSLSPRRGLQARTDDPFNANLQEMLLSPQLLATPPRKRSPNRSSSFIVNDSEDDENAAEPSQNSQKAAAAQPGSPLFDGNEGEDVLEEEPMDKSNASRTPASRIQASAGSSTKSVSAMSPSLVTDIDREAFDERKRRLMEETDSSAKDVLRALHMCTGFENKSRALLLAEFDLLRLDPRTRKWIFTDEEDSIIMDSDLSAELAKLQEAKGVNIVEIRRHFLNSLQLARDTLYKV